jgi:hypothetical protein
LLLLGVEATELSVLVGEAAVTTHESMIAVNGKCRAEKIQSWAKSWIEELSFELLMRSRLSGVPLKKVLSSGQGKSATVRADRWQSG